MSYTQLTAHERYVIASFRLRGHTLANIARRIGRSPGTVCRELQRNADPRNPQRVYYHGDAQQRAEDRRTQANQRYKLDDSPVGRYVREKLNARWSPQQIHGRLAREQPDDPAMRVSHETIYRWVFRRAQLGERWHEQLRRRRAHRRRRIVGDRRTGRLPGRVGIEHRPGVVDQRDRFGDWESDTVEGAKGGGALATHVERRSRYLLARKLADKRACTFTHASVAALRTIPTALRHTLTADNGKEFARFDQMQRQLRMTVYFADPHAPWQRGANENTNGLLRDFFPKGMDLTGVCHRRVAKAQRLLNNRPRKCLNYRTPLEVLNALPGVALRN